MPCFHPLRAWTRARSGGKNIITFKHPGFDNPDPIQLPCGQCIGCRLDRSKSWAIRCIHEATLHEGNAFITLTYKNIENPSLQYRDFQLFMKRLRKQLAPTKIRFYMCGEYGKNQDDVKAKMQNPRLGRKHFHAIIFGTNFKDRYYLKKTNSGETIYRSPTLEKAWTLGHSSTADVTFQSAAYVARYILKKVTGEKSVDHYIDVNDYGEITQNLKPEFTQMSRDPGIGKAWFDKYHTDVYPSDQVVTHDKKGVKINRPPKYYDSLLEKMDPKMHDSIKSDRVTKAKEHYENNTPQRLKTREIIQAGKLKKLKRN